jgi:inorganic pyrophosphatase
MQINRLKLYAGKDDVFNVVIETPRSSRNKYAFDPETELFELKKVLPMGMTFPFDFGFFPSTISDDGDPLDVLILMDEPAFCGCKVEVRLLGTIEAVQYEKDKKERNDRLLAVAVNSKQHQRLSSIKDIEKKDLEEITYFFTSYNKLSGRKFEVINYGGPKTAIKSVKAAHEKFTRK